MLGVSIERPATPAPAVQRPAAPDVDVAVMGAAQGESLPRTGASAISLALAGLGTLGTGTVLTRKRRR